MNNPNLLYASSPGHEDACYWFVCTMYLNLTMPALTARFTFFLSQLGIDPSDPSIRHSSVIKKVAEWARNNNRNDQSDPLQFDIAVLIRR